MTGVADRVRGAAGWRLDWLGRVWRHRAGWRRLGGPALLATTVAPLLGRLAGRRPRPLRLAGFAAPVCYRPGASDPMVAQQVYLAGEYACVAADPGVRTVVDLGANVGYATHYLLSRLPHARAVVVEPDAGNMRVCRRTLAPFAGRVTFLQAGVWSRAGPLVVGGGRFRDDREWSVQVRPAGPGEAPDCQAVTVSDVLAAAGFDTVDILKVDIEGAEAELFRDAAGWLGRVRTLVIELHGPECEAVVEQALRGYRFTRERHGELTVFRDLRPADPCA